jgi:hypothetical protein
MMRKKEIGWIKYIEIILEIGYSQKIFLAEYRGTISPDKPTQVHDFS